MARAASGIPLDVTTYREGWLRLRGWVCFSALAFWTGALLVLYELVCVGDLPRLPAARLCLVCQARMLAAARHCKPAATSSSSKLLGGVLLQQQLGTPCSSL